MRIQLHIMMRVFSLFFLLTFSQFGYTQIIEGGTYQFFTCAGKTETYVYYGGNSSVTNNVYCQVTWTVTGGVILYNGNELTTLGTGTDSSTGISQVNVKWTTEGTSGTITATANTCHNGSSSKTITFQKNSTQLLANPSTVNVGALTTLTANPQFNFNSIAWSSTSGASVTAKPTVAATYTAKVNFNASLEVNFATVKTITCNSQSSVNVNVVVPPITGNTISTDGTIYFNNPGVDIDPAAISGSIATGGTSSISYQWQSSTESSTGGFADMQGATGVNLDPSPISGTTYYRRVATSSSASMSVSNVIAFTIIHNNSIQFSDNPNSSTLNYYASSATPLISGVLPTGTLSSFSYHWIESNDGNTWRNVYGSDGTTHAPSEIVQTTYYAREAYIYDVNNNVAFTGLSNILIAYVYYPIEDNSICCNQTVYGTDSPNVISGTSPSGFGAPISASWESSTDNVNWSYYNSSGGLNLQPASGLVGDVYFRRVLRYSVPTGNPPINVSNSVKITYRNTIPPGATFGNPFLTSTFGRDCQQFQQTVNPLNGDFTNSYGGSGNDVYFRIDSQVTLIGVATCNSTASLYSIGVYLFDVNHNLITYSNAYTDPATGNTGPCGIGIFQRLDPGTY